MKKTKILAAVAAAAVLSVGGAFAGCTGDEHTHTYSEDWKSDAVGHWHVATCDDLKEGDKDYRSGYASHVWGDDNECDICHYTSPIVSEYTVTLDKGEGTLPEGTETTLTTVNGKLETLPTPEAPDGKKFDGWFTEATGGSKVDDGYAFTGETKEVTIYAQYSDETPTPPPTETTITIDKETLTLGLGNLEAELEATITNGAEGAEVEWASDNETVVAVGEETGAVEALKPGSATITATIKGTQISATCEVVVEDAYYLIGSPNSWTPVGTLDNTSASYFMPTETEGIYKVEHIELTKMAEFQVGLVGYTANDWSDKAAIRANCNSTADDNDLTVEGNNFHINTHGYYTITLDLTGGKANAVVSGVMTEEIDDSNVEYIYYLRGAPNGWAEATDETTAGVYMFKSNNDGTYSLTIKLTASQEFKVAIVGTGNSGWDGAFGESALPRDKIGTTGTATTETTYQLTWTSSDNMGVGVTGWYTFTLTPDGGTYQKLTYTFSETDPSTPVTPTPDPEA